MITKENYFDKVSSIDYNTLPEALKEGFDTVKFGSKDYTTWEYLEDDPEFLNLYFSKLNIFNQSKVESEKLKEKNEKAKSKPVKAKKENTTFNYENREVEIRAFSKKSKRLMIWDIKSNQKFANESFSNKEDAMKFIVDNKMVLVEKTQEGFGVEHLSEEIKFIRKFVALHGKTKNKEQILSQLNSLQKAIIEKRIRKTSPYSAEILHIQEQLIKLQKAMKNEVKVELNSETLKKYATISNSEHIMTSINLIKRYLSLHGKENVRDKVAILMKQMTNAVKHKKLLASDPYALAVDKLYKSLHEYYILKKTKSPKIHPSELNGITALLPFSSAVLNKKKVKVRIKNDFDLNLRGVESKSNSSVISSSELTQMQFNTIGLKGKFQELIGDPSQGFTCMVFGKPKSGKSTLCIDFAKHLAEHHGKVLYTAIEEGYGYTLKEKMERLKAVHPNLFISESIPANVGTFDFVFIDSVSKGKMDNDMLNQLHQKNPKTAFIFIFHSTKDGDFRGGQQNAHDVDCIIEVKDGVAFGKGRFGIGGEAKVFD